MDNASPLVSVIAVNYNFERFVLDALNSIREQSYPNIELIVIDDHSRDNSVSLIREWSKDFDRPFKLLVNERNLGICATLNKAFDEAQGKYISATSTDDIYMPDKISHQVALMERASSEVCAVYSDAYLITEDGTLQTEKFIGRRNVRGIPQGHIFEDLLTDNFIPAMSVLLRTACYRDIGHFDDQLVYEDYDMWLRLARKYQFLFSDYISVQYRIKSKSLSTSIDWDLPNTRILLKHLNSHPGVLRKLQEMTLKAYRKNNDQVLQMIDNASISDPFIRKLLFFKRFHLPKKLSLQLLGSLK